jgi:hypothetical protein
LEVSVLKKIPALVAAAYAVFCLAVSGGAAVKGTVVDRMGRPIPKAKVAVLRWDGNAHKTVADVVFCDEKGHFSCSSGGNVQITADGYSVWGGYRNSDSEMTITLFPELRQKGKVVDENGKPIAGAKVGIQSYYVMGNDPKSASNYQNERGLGIIPDVLTGRDGSFVLHHIPDISGASQVQVCLHVVKEGRARVLRWLRGGDLGSDLEIVEPRECILQGRVLRSDGSPVPPGTDLMVMLTTFGNMDTRSAVTTGNGSYKFTELPPADVKMARVGSLDTKETSDWVLPITSGVHLVAGKTVTLNPVEVKAAKISGTVVGKDGKPIPRASLLVTDGSRARFFGNGDQCDADGKFQVSVAPGTVGLSVCGYSTQNGYVNLFNNDEAPTALSPSAGEEIAGIKLQVTENENRYDLYARAERTPTPSDLRLTSGVYELAWDADLNLTTALYAGPRSQGESLSKKIKGLSKLVSSKPYVVEYTLDGLGDDGGLVIVCDESKGTGKGYDTAYIDTNRNWDISDEKPISWSIDEAGGGMVTGWTEVQSHQGSLSSEHTNHPVMIRLSVYRGGGNYFQVRPERKGGWRGSIESNKGKIEFVPIDGDLFYADVNGIGHAVLWTGDRHMMRASEVSSIANRLYKIRVNGIGNKVSVEPYDGPAGTISVKISEIGGLKGRAVSLGISGATGEYSLKDLSDSSLLPVGMYTLQNCDIALGSKQLNNLNISVSLTRELEVKPNGHCSVEIGGKISGSIDPDKKETVLYSGGTSTFQWLFKIGNDVTVSSLGDFDSARNVRVRLYDQGNALVYSGTAGYTGGGYCMYLVQVPKLKSGVYTMQVSLDTKSEWGILSSMKKVTISPAPKSR